jgi:MYXO-CTERM domain-containing protein
MRLMLRTAFASMLAIVFLVPAHALAPADGIALGSATIELDGAHVGPMVIALAALGRGSLDEVSASPAHRVGAEVRIERAPGVTEWWRSDTRGLEQGVTIASRPSGEGPLVLEMRTGVDHVRGEGDAMQLLDDSGALVGTYSELVVRDAADHVVAAHMIAANDRIRIEVDDTSAAYPIVVDPLVWAIESMLFRNWPDGSAALSADGAYAVVGGGQQPTTNGQADVWFRVGSSWSQQATLRSTTASIAVAISADGLHAVVGDPSNTNTGSYVRIGTMWMQDGNLPVPTGARSLALAADGSRAIAGCPMSGAALVFVRNGGPWMIEAQLNTASPGDNFGQSVAIDSTGTRVIIGGPVGSTNTGSATVYVRSGNMWTLETTFTGVATNTSFGASVALSANGSIALVGAPACTGASGSGSAYVFTRGATWSSAGTQLLPTDDSAGDCSGYAVALDAAGDLALLSTVSFTGGGRFFVRSGTTWTQDARVAGATTSLRGTVAALSALGDRAILVSPGSSSMLSVLVTARDPLGAHCDTDSVCMSGHCADGVCCTSACGGSMANDCQACTAALTGGVDGTCAALSASTAPTVTCRPSVGVCDAAEQCTSSMMTCPSDALQPSSHVCNPSLGGCDPAENCTGTSTTCPANVISPMATVCRPNVGVCDIAAVCDGSSVTCPANAFAAATTVCRPSVSACDPVETCTGTSAACPADQLAPAGTACGAAAGLCDQPRVCSGTSAICPSNFRPSTYVCGPSSGAVCDIDRHCSGSSAECPPIYATGVVCRPAAGACDIPESCSGTSVNCPPDGVEGAGTVCRASTASCDPAESCDGTSTMCPADATTCMAQPDAGAHDAGLGTTDASASDGGHDAATASGDASSSDAATAQTDAAGAPPPAAGGCACRTGGSGASSLAWIVLAALLVLRRRAVM